MQDGEYSMEREWCKSSSVWSEECVVERNDESRKFWLYKAREIQLSGRRVR